ncbi:MAG: macro domain-containing protein [Planctomycetota bacterium]|jgi:O-acetyl-ADP-ribose deacetylase (regulator of RNase III)
METKINQTHLELVQGDITDQAVDAIVNAANSQLILGGGVAGAIRQKGGPAVQSECNLKAPIDVGQAAMTTAGDLNAKHVIHVVGPRMGEGDEDDKLKMATINTLKLADKNSLSSLAFCAISTGIFGYPKDRCAKIMLTEIITYLNGNTGLQQVNICLYDKAAYNIFARELELLV